MARIFEGLLVDKGIALRGRCIIDPDGVLQWANVSNWSTGRSVDEVLRTLAALQTCGRMPCGWQPGEATIQ
ncbi:MAG: hypothetical protein HYU66_06925 [Armatimonadetes bacterium]|nr:hypothetical protein [Armatimonadota bacterium]